MSEQYFSGASAKKEQQIQSFQRSRSQPFDVVPYDEVNSKLLDLN
jgi:hypothetical protein